MKRTLTTISDISPLELTMRDVLDAMDEFATEFMFHSTPDTFTILSCGPPDDPGGGARPEAVTPPRQPAMIARHRLRRAA